VKDMPLSSERLIITCAMFFPIVFSPIEVARLLSHRASTKISLADAVLESVNKSKDVLKSARLF
jgi:hypothetical protein